MKKVLLVAFLMLGCGDPNLQPQRQTGPVEVLSVRLFRCTAGDCNIDLMLKTPSNTVYTLHLEDSYSLPPVWQGMRTNIVYIQVPGSEKMRVLWATELK